MPFDKQELINRIQDLAVQMITVLDLLPSKRANQKIADQVIRSSLSVGANYRAACRAKSTLDFINKLKIVEEEANETIFFIEVLIRINENQFHNELNKLKFEYDKILSIVVSAITTTRSRLKNEKK